jgi:hypothetical protein
MTTLPPPLRAAVHDLDEATRILERLVGWVPALGSEGYDEWLTGCAADLAVARDRVLAAWRTGETSTGLASLAIRRSVDALLERLYAGLS